MQLRIQHISKSPECRLRRVGQATLDTTDVSLIADAPAALAAMLCGRADLLFSDGAEHVDHPAHRAAVLGSALDILDALASDDGQPIDQEQLRSTRELVALLA